jgi:hypothetical protein
MIQSSSSERFFVKSINESRIAGEIAPQNLYCNFAMQPLIICDVDISHSAGANHLAKLVAIA